MRRSVFTLIPIFLLTAASLAALPSYRIHARWDEVSKTMSGTMTLDWVNESPDTITTLQFHTYMNAFKDNRSTFMRESGGKLRGIPFSRKERGYIRILTCRIRGFTHSFHFISPDDGNPWDRTVMEVSLSQPLPPGGSVSVEMTFRTRLPKVFARTGYAGDFVMVGQWFPKIGVWQAGRGWNCHQFHANSEFFADFADWDVTIDLPEGEILAATGVPGRTETRSGRTIHHVTAQRIHDFSFAFSPRFVLHETTFDPATAYTPGEKQHWSDLLGLTPEDWAALKKVKIILYAQPDHERQARRHLEAARQAMKYFSIWFCPYPYPRLSIVDPPIQGLGAGGMEYPTLICTISLPLLDYLGLSGLHMPEETTVHEYAHNTFYGLVASNEFEESCLDEGFTCFATSQLMERVYGEHDMTIPYLGLSLSQVDKIRINHGANYPYDPVETFSWRFINSTSYGFNSYDKPNLILHQLKALMGEKAFFRMMRDYAMTWHFRHPTLEDFIAVVRKDAGPDLAGKADTWFHGDTRADYAVFSVKNRRDRAIVTVRRRGVNLHLPVTVRITFENEKVETRTWDGERHWHRWTFPGATEVKMVEVDPDEKILFDSNRINNTFHVRRVPAARRAFSRMTGRVAQLLLEVLLWFN